MAALTRWKTFTDTAALGRCSPNALRKAGDGSIATTWTSSRHFWGRAASQAPTPAESRPSTTPNTCPVVVSTIVDIQGSNRCQAPAASR